MVWILLHSLHLPCKPAFPSSFPWLRFLMYRGGRVAVCVPDLCTCEWWAGSSSPLPLFSSPRSRQPEQLEHPHYIYIYDRAPPTSRLYSDGMWANAHSSSRGFSSCSCMNVCTGAIFQVLFVFTMHSLQCECSVMPLGHHMVNWMYMKLIGLCCKKLLGLSCVGTGGLASTVATRGVNLALHSDTGCYVTGICRSPSLTPQNASRADQLISLHGCANVRKLVYNSKCNCGP